MHALAIAIRRPNSPRGFGAACRPPKRPAAAAAGAFAASRGRRRGRARRRTARRAIVRASVAQFLSLFRVVNFVAVPVDPGRLERLQGGAPRDRRLIGEHVEMIADPGPPSSSGR